MLFTSVAYLIFLPLVFIIYRIIRADRRWVVLLISGYFFYACFNVKYTFLLLAVTLISYYGALLIDKDRQNKRLYLTGCGILIFAALIWFKYFNFLIKTFNDIAGAFGALGGAGAGDGAGAGVFGGVGAIGFVDIVLPIGISFYTFQAFSYVIDVYRESIKPERHFGYYAVFVSFFPKISQGPIERAESLLPQLHSAKEFDYPLAVYGLRRMLWGYFKKLIIADSLAYYVDIIFGSYPEFEGFTLVVGMFFFTIQIYADFSGYSDIAIGSAALFGIRLTENFKSPYFSSSVKEFFSRWHVSLSTWFRDYVYIPLGGNRCSKGRCIFNIMITMLVSGLWHGADWTYVAWGGIHGVGNVLTPAGKKNRGQVRGAVWWLKVCGTFVFCMLAWTFFRAFDFKCTFSILTRMFNGIGSPAVYFINGYCVIGITARETILFAASIFALGVFDYFSLDKDVMLILDEIPRAARFAIYAALTLIIIYFVPTHGNAEFLYFKF